MERQNELNLSRTSYVWDLTAQCWVNVIDVFLFLFFSLSCKLLQSNLSYLEKKSRLIDGKLKTGLKFEFKKGAN